MERRDQFVALAGAAIVAIATLAAGFGATQDVAGFEVVVYQGREGHLPGDMGSRTNVQETTFSGSFDLDALQLDGARLVVNATTTGPGLTPATLHVTLTAPNGTRYESEGDAAGPLVRVQIAVPGTPRLAPMPIDAQDAEEAWTQVRARLPEPVNGTWHVDARYATDGPAPAPAVQAEFAFEYVEWVVDVLPRVPGR